MTIYQEGVVKQVPVSALQGKRILFANFPGDGHFNPLTGLAAHLKNEGCDVRWYTSSSYEPRIAEMGIPFYPLKKALDVSQLEEIFPGREKLNGKIAKLKFDIINAFVLRAPEYYEDMLEIYQEFKFDLVIADCLFTAVPFITDKMNIPTIAIGVLPLTENSRDLPPTGLGMTPDYSWLGRIKQAALRFVSEKILFREPSRVMCKMLDDHGISHKNTNLFDIVAKKATLLLQSGTPGFEYYRSDLNKNVRFIGPLLPYRKASNKTAWFDPRLKSYDHIVLATQGTVEKDVEKLLVPTLEALKGTDILLVVTTGGSKTEELRARYPQENIIIEDFIVFSDIMPYADVYVTNGGYGGVMLGIRYQLPMVVAGVHEGKNEINARIGYFKLGINLNTEKPTAAAVKKSVTTLLNDKQYKENVKKLQEEFALYEPEKLCGEYVEEAIRVRRDP